MINLLLLSLICTFAFLPSSLEAKVINDEVLQIELNEKGNEARFWVICNDKEENIWLYGRSNPSILEKFDETSGESESTLSLVSFQTSKKAGGILHCEFLHGASLEEEEELRRQISIEAKNLTTKPVVLLPLPINTISMSIFIGDEKRGPFKPVDSLSKIVNGKEISTLVFNFKLNDKDVAIYDALLGSEENIKKAFHYCEVIYTYNKIEIPQKVVAKFSQNTYDLDNEKAAKDKNLSKYLDSLAKNPKNLNKLAPKKNRKESAVTKVGHKGSNNGTSKEAVDVALTLNYRPKREIELADKTIIYYSKLSQIKGGRNNAIYFSAPNVYLSRELGISNVSTTIDFVEKGKKEPLLSRKITWKRSLGWRDEANNSASFVSFVIGKCLKDNNLELDKTQFNFTSEIEFEKGWSIKSSNIVESVLGSEFMPYLGFETLEFDFSNLSWSLRNNSKNNALKKVEMTLKKTGEKELKYEFAPTKTKEGVMEYPKSLILAVDPESYEKGKITANITFYTNGNLKIPWVFNGMKLNIVDETKCFSFYDSDWNYEK